MRPIPFFSLAVLLFLCISTSAVFGQDEDKNQYMSEVQGQSLLYRGKIEKHYSFKYRGTYFAYQEDFVVGQVYYNRKLYTGVLLNLNAQNDQLLVRQSNTHLPVVLDKTLVDWFVLGDKRFAKIEEGGEIGLTGGYYEVFIDGKYQVLKKITKEYREELVASGQDSRIDKVFGEVTDYYIRQNGEYVRITGKSTFVKIFKEYKKDINRVYRDATRAVRSDKDVLYRKVMEAVR